MSNRPEVLTVALDRDRHTEQKAALTELAARLETTGKISGLARFLADAYLTMPEETLLFLMALFALTRGGDKWSTFSVLSDLLPPLSLTPQDGAAAVGRQVEQWINRMRIMQAAGRNVTLADIAASDPAGYAALVEVVRNND